VLKSNKKGLGRAVAIVLLTGSLAACAATNTRTIVNKPGFSDFFTYAAAGRDFKISVLGDPFAGKDAELTQTTITAFQRNYGHLNTRFTTTPNDTALPPYHIVVAYGDVLFGAENEVCQGKLGAVPPSAPGKLQILAVFCDDNAVTFNRAMMPKPSGPNDPALADTLNLLAWRLIPEAEDATHNRVFGTGQ